MIVGDGPRRAELEAFDEPGIVITLGDHARGAGAAGWFLDAGESLPDAKLARRADAVLCAGPEDVARVHAATGAPVLAVPPGGPALSELIVPRGRGAGRRLLLVGPVNAIHVEHQAIAMRELGWEVIVAGVAWPGPAPPELPLHGIPVACAPGPLVPWLARLLRRLRPDVVHAHWMPFGFKALVAGARPLVVSPWGSDVYGVPPHFRAANAVVARLAARVVPDSRDLVAALGARRATVLNWGVDLETFAPGPRAAARERLGLPGGPLILHPRTIKPLYNVPVILDAFRRVRERLPDAQLALKHMANEPPADLGPLPHGVHVVGRVDYEAMADWYRAADVCVSIPRTDSSPRSVWEALACGCPTVVSDLPWVHESLREGETALVVEPAAGPLAAAIERVLSDRELAERLAREGRALVERTRDRRTEMARLSALYEELA